MLKRFNRRFYDANDPGGSGGDKTIEISAADLAAMKKGVDSQSAEVKATKEAMEELTLDMAKMGGKLEQSHADLLAFKDLLGRKHGKSGTEDFEHELSKHVSGQFHAMHPKGNRNHELAKAFMAEKDYDTMTDATAAYLIDDQMAAGIMELTDVYGKIVDRVTRFNLAPGTTLKINRDLLLPTAKWRTTATHATTPTSAEGTAIPDMVGGTFAQLSLEPILAGCKFTSTNEMLASPSIGFGAMMAAKAARAIIRLREASILSGKPADVLSSPPSDGLCVDGNVTDLTDITTGGLTMAKLLTFIANACASYAPLEDTIDNKILIPTAQYFNIAGETVNASNAAFIWANPRENIPMTVFGYELIHHADMTDGTDNFAAIGDPGAIVEVLAPGLEIGFNPYGSSWDNNQTDVRVFTHANYGMGQPLAWKRAAFA